MGADGGACGVEIGIEDILPMPSVRDAIIDQELHHGPAGLFIPVVDHFADEDCVGALLLVYDPFKGLRLGAAYVRGSESGTPDYIEDRLYSLEGFDFRGDLYKGATKVSVLLKYASRHAP